MSFSRVHTRGLVDTQSLWKVTHGTAAANKALVTDVNTNITGLTLTNPTIVGLTLDGGTISKVYDNIFAVANSSDPTKLIEFSAAGNTTAITTTIASQSTGAATITLPAATSTLATLAGVETLTNKTLTGSINTNTKVSTADPAPASTALVDIAGLTTALVAGATYKFRCVLSGLADGTSGISYAFKYTTATLTSIEYAAVMYTASAVSTTHGTTTTDATLLADKAAALTLTILEGTMVVNAGGSVKLQAATHTGTTAAAVYVGSTMDFTRIA